MAGGNLLQLRKFVAPEFVFGLGAADLAGRYAHNLGAHRVLLVTDPGLEAHGYPQRVRRDLAAQGLSSIDFHAVSTNPRDTEVMAGAEIYRQEGCEAIVAVGGGSPMDCAKAVGIVCTNRRHVLDFEGVDKVDKPGPPLICIPTTAGSSADVSQFAIITDTARKVKIAIVSKTMVPDASLVDPALTASMSPELTACTGLDALTHAIEAYVSNASSPISDLHALEAVRQIGRNLPRAFDNPGDLEARGGMMLGSLLAGLAFSNAILGAVHAMAHSLGGLKDLPHGQCNAILLDHVMDFNYAAAPERFDDVGRALGADLPGTAPAGERKALVLAAVRRLKERLGIDLRLRDLGVSAADLPRLAGFALADPCLATNPRPAGPSELEAIYAQAL